MVQIGYITTWRYLLAGIYTASGWNTCACLIPMHAVPIMQRENEIACNVMRITMSVICFVYRIIMQPGELAISN